MTAISWKQALSGDWSTAARWSSGTVPLAGDDVTIGLAGNYTVTVTHAQVARSIAISGLASSFVESSAGKLTTTAGLSVTAGTVVLNAANSLGGGVSIGGGEVAVGAPGALGTGLLTLDGGELLSSITQTLSPANGAAAGLLMLDSFGLAAAHGTTLTVNPSDGWTLTASTYGAIMSIGGGGADGTVVWKTPTGSATQGTAQDQTLDVGGGTFQAGDASFGYLLDFMGTVQVDAGAILDTQTYGTSGWVIHYLTGDGSITGSAGILTINYAEFGGQITGGLGVQVYNEATFSGANSYTGDSQFFNGSEVDVDTGGQLGKGTIYDESTIKIYSTSGVNLSGPLTGTGTLELDSAGQTTLGGANSLGGEVTLQQGATLVLANATALGGSGELVLDNGKLLAATSSTVTRALDIVADDFVFGAAAGKILTLDGTAASHPWTIYVQKYGTTLEFGSAGYAGRIIWASPSGSTTDDGSGGALHIKVQAGVLQAGDANFSDLSDASGADTAIAAGASIDVAGHSINLINLTGSGSVVNSSSTLAQTAVTALTNTVFAGAFTGAQQVELYGGTLTGTSTHTGGTTLGIGGTGVTLGNGGTTGAIPDSAIVILGSLTFDRSDSVTYNSNITGGGDIYQIGTGTTILNGANTISGVDISAGTLAAGNGAAFGAAGFYDMEGGELLGTGSGTERLAGTITLNGSGNTFGAATGTVLDLDGPAWNFNLGTDVRDTVYFGKAGQTGTVVWHTNGSPAFSGNGQYQVEVRAGTLQPGDDNDSLLSTVFALDAGAKLDLAGFNLSTEQFSGAGAVISSGVGTATFQPNFGDFTGSIVGNIALVTGVEGAITVHGTTAADGGATVSNQSDLENYGTYELRNDNGVTGTTDTLAGVFINNGTFEKIGGAGTSNVTAEFYNHGLVIAQIGSIAFSNTFINYGVMQGVLTHSGSTWTLAANAAGQSTYFGGSEANLVKVAVAPTYFDGGAGGDTLKLTASMTLLSGSLVSVETIIVDNGVTADLSALAIGENIVLASLAGGGSTVHATQGNDLITSGAGTDTMYGNGGDDTFLVNSALDKVFEAAGGGSDTVHASVSYGLAAGQEIETLATNLQAGTTAINLTGNSLAQTIVGNAGTNVLSGGGGADLMYGLGGNDTYVVSDATAKVFEAAGGGSDTVHASVSYALQAGQEIETLATDLQSGTNAINLTGNNLAQTIIGNAGANVLTGGGGADSMSGLGGNDTYVVSDATAKVFEAVGGGNDIVHSSVSYALQAGQEIETLATNLQSGTAAINLTGNEFGQTVNGNNGVNVINGGLGNDHLFGGGAADTFVFSTALNASTNLDHISDFTPVDDTVQLSHAVFAAIAAGTLADAAFYEAAGAVAAHDADDRIVYNTSTGGLYYDADGQGGAAATEFAILDNHAAITHADFLIA